MKKLVTEKMLRHYIRRQLMIQQCRTEGFLPESIDSRIQKRLDALLNDPEYSNVFITEGIETVREIITEELIRLRVQESPAAIAAVLAGQEMGAPKNRKPASAPFGGYSMGVKQRRKTEEEIIDALKDASLSLDGIESDRLNTGMLMGLTDAQLEALVRRVHEPTWLQKIARKVGAKNIKKR